jgi:cyanophycinase
MSKLAKGRLIIIGGREDRHHARVIPEHVAQSVGGSGRLAVLTVASYSPDGVGPEYRKIFRKLGVKKVDVIDLKERPDAHSDQVVEALKRATTILMTGGDQLRITSQMGDTPAFRTLEEHYLAGGTIAGTSAGAAAMSETMLISGPSDQSHKLDALNMAPGLGLIDSVVIDTHFAERGRIGRLLGAVAQNPRVLGMGIDEDTAVILEPDNHMRVIGSGAVYVVDGTGITFTSLSESDAEEIVSIHDVRVHVLGQRDCFDLEERRPYMPDVQSPADSQPVECADG